MEQERAAASERGDRAGDRPVALRLKARERAGRSPGALRVAWRGNLPAPFASFVGRERQVQEVARLLGSQRLVTLVGAPGVGKTRLALRVAEQVQDGFADGAWLVELGGLAEPALVASAVARALGVRQTQRPSLEALRRELRDRALLLVLDNCEHLLEACATVADVLLTNCPDLRILATSRRPLGLIGELVWQVPSLNLPERADAGGRAPAESRALRTLLGSEAGQLFVERAREVRPGFTPTERQAEAIAEICRRLDGVPLALELAAARLRVLSPEQLAARLDDRFTLLAGGSPTAPPRQRTLRALVDWSHHLLAEPAQVLLRRLAVFAGGWTLEAAEAVCGEGTLDLLGQLVDQSLVVAEEQGGQARYRMLETIHEYALERLREAGEEAAVRGRHQDWCLELAEWAAPRVLGSELVVACERVSAELDNVRAALAWARQAPAAERELALERALRLAGALCHFWDMRGHLVEGRAWLDELLGRVAAIGGAAESGALGRARGRALGAAGYLAYVPGETAAAERLLSEAVDQSRAVGDEFFSALSLSHLAITAVRRGELERATGLLEETLAAARRIGSCFLVAACEFYLGELAAVRGDWPEAAARFEASLALTRREGILWGTAYLLAGLGQIATIQGHHERAAALEREALTIRFELDTPRDIAFSLGGLAMTLAAGGDSVRAARLLGAAEALLDRLGVAEVLLADWPARREQAVATLRTALGEATFEAEYAQGRAFPLEQAIELALDERRQPPPARAPAVGAGALTTREREVAALMARGLTNQEIGRELVLSERTIEWHVGNILGKLGLGSRAQVIAWMAEQPPTTSRGA